MIQKKKAIILAVAVVIVLGIAYGMGMFTAEDAKYFGRDMFYRGKGTVEGAVDAVTNVTATGSGDPTKARACRENLRRIELAKRAAANTLSLTVGEVPENEILSALGGGLPKCPDGGRYKINDLQYMPTCNIGAGVVSDPNDDHVLNNL